MTVDDFVRLVSPLKSRVVNMVARALIKSVDDSKNAQAAQVEVLKDELRDVERLQNYGFTSVPKAGAEAVVLRVNGKADHTIVIVCEDRRYRLTGLEDGEVALYDVTGSKVVLKSSGDIEITPSSGTAKVSGDFHVTGDVNCDGTVTGSTDCVGGGKSLKGHKHSGSTLTTTALVATDGGSPGTIGGDTDVPL